MYCPKLYASSARSPLGRRAWPVAGSLVALVLVSCCLGAWAREPATGADAGGKKLATVNPMVVAPPSGLAGTGGAAAFHGTTSSYAGGIAKPANKHKSSAKASDALEPFSQLEPALKDLQQDTASALGIAKDRLEKLTGTRFEQVTAWAARTYRHFMSPPVMTPAAAPYVVDRYMHAPMYLTKEGRLKTVTGR